jgi:ubiquinone/menaquinone biosynthesis C-methylase UbiE
METDDEVREYEAMDHSQVNARFVADFQAAHGPCQGGEILDVGTGTARIPIALARADSAARVRALDLSATMLSQASKNIAAAGLSGRIATEHGDARSLVESLGPGRFEGVISNTIIHHIPDPAPVLAVMALLVAPGGTLMIRDLVRPDSMTEIGRLVDLYAAGESADARALLAASLNAALTLDEIRSLIAALGHDGSEVVMTSDRHWTWTWRRPR